MTVTILVGDVRERLAQLPDASVQCVVTSPPYYGLRDYGTAQWDGGDPDCDHTRQSAVSRASSGLDGATTTQGGAMAYGRQCGKCGAVRIDAQIGLEPTLAEYIAAMVEVFRGVKRVLRDDGCVWLNCGDSFENKQLLMVPARLAIALQDDGWWLRSDVIWHKPNPMPESCRDRPSTAHEHIFLLTKNGRYFYDAEAVKTEAKAPTTKMPDGWDTGAGAHGAFHRNGREAGARTSKQHGHSRRHDGFNDRWDEMSKAEQEANGANLRNVWTIATQGFSGAHFATFPPEIPRRCIKAGTKPGDTVLDPFGGAGTVGLVADEMGRNAILIELNPEYARLAHDRIVGASPMFADVVVEAA